MKLPLKVKPHESVGDLEGMTKPDSRFFSINPMDGKGQGEEAAVGGHSIGGAALGASVSV
jgi:hypothetical protein